MTEKQLSPNKSKLYNFYRQTSSDLSSYIQNLQKNEFLAEHLFLKELMNQKENDLNFLFFSISALLDSPFYLKIIPTIFLILNKKHEEKFILFRHKIIKKLNEKDEFIPFLMEIFKNLDQLSQISLNTEDTENVDKKIFEKKIKIDQQILKNSNFQRFLLDEILEELKKVLKKFSKSISFPELGEFVSKNLSKNYKLKKYFKKIIELIRAQSDLIKKQRKDITILDENSRKEFNNKIVSLF